MAHCACIYFGERLEGQRFRTVSVRINPVVFFWVGLEEVVREADKLYGRANLKASCPAPCPEDGYALRL